MDKQNLTKRLFFALWAVPCGWWIINSQFSLLPSSLSRMLVSSPDAYIRPGMVLAVVLVFLATAEYFSMIASPYRKNGFWLIYIWLGYRTFSYFNEDISLSSGAGLDHYVLLVIVALEAAVWGKGTKRWKRASLLFSGAFFLSIAQYALLALYGSRFARFFPPFGGHSMLSSPGILTVVAAIFMTDTAAFFTGTFWGRHHFSSISPKKTLEGGVAGLCAAIIVSIVGWQLFAAEEYPLWIGILMGTIIGFSAQAGDLLVSAMKRYFRVKDASNLIPGHGGILDRFDSVFFTAPVLQLFFVLISRIMGN